MIESLLPKVDSLLVGGGMCFTFLAAQGLGVGDSLLEHDQIDNCRGCSESGKIVLPADVVVADDFSAEANTHTVPADAIPDGWKGLDIGPESVAAFAQVLAGAETVFWNGPMGVFELAPFAEGTRGVAQAIVETTGGRRARSAWSAAATRPPRCARSACPRTGSPTSPPAAARRWSTSRARTCPVSPSWRRRQT